MEEGARQERLELALAVVGLFEDEVMPTYDYRCDKCGHEFELFQSMTASVLKKCPACGQSALKKQISAPRFRLSGTGWYETDFKSDKQRNLADSGNGKDGDKKPDKAEKSGKSEKSEKKGSASKKDAAA